MKKKSYHVHSLLIIDKLFLPELIKVLDYGTLEVKINSPVKKAIIKIGSVVLDIHLY